MKTQSHRQSSPIDVWGLASTAAAAVCVGKSDNGKKSGRSTFEKVVVSFAQNE